MPQKKRTKPPAKMTAYVTQKDIDEGEQGSSARCPIALALKRNYGDHPSVGAHYVTMSFDEVLADHTFELTYLHNERGERFVESFDRDKASVKPGRYTVTYSHGNVWPKAHPYRSRVVNPESDLEGSVK